MPAQSIVALTFERREAGTTQEPNSSDSQKSCLKLLVSPTGSEGADKALCETSETSLFFPAAEAVKFGGRSLTANPLALMNLSQRLVYGRDQVFEWHCVVCLPLCIVCLPLRACERVVYTNINEDLGELGEVCEDLADLGLGQAPVLQLPLLQLLRAILFCHRSPL